MLWFRKLHVSSEKCGNIKVFHSPFVVFLLREISGHIVFRTLQILIFLISGFPFFKAMSSRFGRKPGWLKLSSSPALNMLMFAKESSNYVDPRISSSLGPLANERANRYDRAYLRSWSISWHVVVPGGMWLVPGGLTIVLNSFTPLSCSCSLNVTIPSISRASPLHS
jgi:hypothetical protein